MTKLFRNLNSKKAFKIAFFVALLNLLNIECVVAKSLEEAKELCDKKNDGAACENVVDACFLGPLFFGKTRTIDEIKCAYEYGEKGCNLNSANSCYYLGSMYLDTNPGHRKDLQKAQELLQKSCDLGNLDACGVLSEKF